MSAVSQAQQIPRLAHTGRVTPGRVALSEWTKLRSLRSTVWSLFAGVLLTILLPVLFAAITSSHWGSMSPHERADRHPLDIALAGVNVSQLAIAVLGVLTLSAAASAAAPTTLTVCIGPGGSIKASSTCNGNETQFDAVSAASQAALQAQVIALGVDRFQFPLERVGTAGAVAAGKTGHARQRHREKFSERRGMRLKDARP